VTDLRCLARPGSPGAALAWSSISDLERNPGLTRGTARASVPLVMCAGGFLMTFAPLLAG